MNHNRPILLGIALTTACAHGAAQRADSTATATQRDSVVAASTDSLPPDVTLGSAQVVARRPGTSRLRGAENGYMLTRDELFKAACCNLGESFVTNPSVDVSYSDAATGARQIRLLGLSGTYVQMLTENMPDFRSAAAPYALGYVPGPWMKSIQVSKGAASVKNGYESITGQINVEYKKPEDEQGAEVDLFGDSNGRLEANADANVHLNEGLSTEVLAHYENGMADHDSNHDGFQDKPRIEQYHLQNRWILKSGRYLFHGGVSALREHRNSGQTGTPDAGAAPLYKIRLNTDRYAAYAKNAYIINPDNGTNVGLITSASMHQLDAAYGLKGYSVNEKNLYASLMLETKVAGIHSISLGASLNHDYLGQRVRLTPDAQLPFTRLNEKETTPGAYAQYTLTLGERLTAMAGLRVDHSSVYGTFLTPRFHVKYTPGSLATFRLSAGKGYRTAHALAENNYLLASGRQLVIGDLRQEAAWNYGASAAFNIPLAGHILKLNAEYYYTRFSDQAVIDYDTDRRLISIGNLDGRSYSHTFQIDATYPLFTGMTLTAAYRYNDAKTTYGGTLRERPLTSRYKGLLTASYKTPLGIWQFDATLQLNGGGRLPDPYTLADGTLSWPRRFHAYEQLSAQVTRWFRHFAIYAGAENLTSRRQKNPIIAASTPWSEDFDPTMIWGPVDGRMFYAGLRINIGRSTF